MPDYLPRQEAKRVAFAGQLAKHLLASPGVYGVTPTEAAAYQALYEQAAAAYRVSQTPGTRTVVTVRAKDQQLAALVKETRRRVKMLRVHLNKASHAGERSAKLAAVGLRPANPSRARLRVPGDPPHLYLAPTMSGGIEVTVRDAAHPQRKAMPRGAMMVQVHVRIPRKAADAAAAPGSADGSTSGESGSEGLTSGGSGGWRLWQIRGVTGFEVGAPPWARPGGRATGWRWRCAS